MAELPPSIDALVSRLSADNPAWRADAEQWLVRLGSAAIVPVLRAFESGPAVLRVHAAHVLGRLRAREAAPVLAARLGDGELNGAVAIAVEAALVRLGDVEALAAALGGEGAARALRALGTLGERARTAAARVEALLSSAHPGVRAQAASALLQIAGPPAIEQVAPMLHDPDKWIRYGAAEGLAALGVARARAVLQVAARDDDEGRWLQDWAEDLLAELDELERVGAGRP